MHKYMDRPNRLMKNLKWRVFDISSFLRVLTNGQKRIKNNNKNNNVFLYLKYDFFIKNYGTS